MSFPQLRLLEGLAARAAPLTQAKLSHTIFVGVQHLLETTGSLFETMLQLGARPENVLLLGKAYSTHSGVTDSLRSLGIQVFEGTPPDSPGHFREFFRRDVERLWMRVLDWAREEGADRIVVIDDGGQCIGTVPLDAAGLGYVAGVEQTTSGLAQPTSESTIPVIQVASAAAKRVLESPMISRAVLKRLPALAGNASCGIAGVGNIGRAMAAHLLERGVKVYLYDRESKEGQDLVGAIWCASLEELVMRSDFLFGCTGEDLFHECEWLGRVSSDKTFVSCSSEDREFRSLLLMAARRDRTSGNPFATITVQLPRAQVKIARGGFPMNFDGSAESVPAREIQVTRYLLLSGMVQSLLRNHAPTGLAEKGRMLSPGLQRLGARLWLACCPDRARDYPDATIQDFEDLHWIASHSGGEEDDVPAIEGMLR